MRFQINTQVLPKYIADLKIKAQELTDKQIYKRFIQRRGRKDVTFEDCDQYCKFDLIQISSDKIIPILDNKILIDFKTRLRYEYTQYPTAIISAHKFGDMMSAKEDEAAQKLYIVSPYPQSDKIVIWDITNFDYEGIINGEDPYIKLIDKIASRCSTQDNSNKINQKYLELPLQPNHFTYVYNEDLSDYKQIMLRNMKNVGIEEKYLFL